MRNKNILWMSLVIPLLFSMAITRVNAQVTATSVKPISAGAAQDIWVEPDFIDNLQKSGEFTVSVMIKVTAPTQGGGTGLYGWECYLKWNTTELSLKSTGEPDLANPAGLNFSYGFWVKKNAPVDSDKVWCAATAFAPDPAFTGVTWLSNYTFRVEKSVFEPSPAHVGHIKMDLVGLVDDKVQDIVAPFTDRDVVEFRIGTTSGHARQLPVQNIAIVVVVAIFFVAALYYMKKRILK